MATNVQPKKAGSSRILTFDLMRGYFLVAIIFDHLNFFPNGLDWWSARGSLFVTAAEGFFLISGLVLGIVRGSKLINEPLQKVTGLLLRRSLQLYITLILSVLLFTFIGWLFFMDNPRLKSGILPPTTNIFEVIWKTLTLQYFYGWVDYLRLYAIFILFSPIVMWMLRKGWWYLVVLVSVVVWSLFPTDPNISDYTQELLQPLSWQLIFFGGMILGFYHKQISVWWHALSQKTQHIITRSTWAVAIVTLAVNIWLAFATQYVGAELANWINENHYELYIYYFDKEQLPLARLVLFAIWFFAAFMFFRHFEKYIVKYTGKLLLPFGTNSLYVYTLHAFLIFFVHLWFTAGNVAFNFVVSIGLVAVIWLAVRTKFLMKIIPR